ncbi:serine/threonine protein kinase [Actinorhabdospora filicis]|uniref:non-specific serine/threonine protein kinase n=1 Tax=Actinorhabdospora filicis TaxID=1785913 RepID=A0A9W6SMT4_9ACTN|nr:class IV lanthionine synthetase LanL [Actinorhabdospora filicis]GLZ78714.1 serine/threonine protein kinase [Actinorhabdospora filicis]
MDDFLAGVARDALTAFPGWRVRAGGQWCTAGPADEPMGVQGWKLHVSATPLSAPVVLRLVAPILARARCPFKFAADLSVVRELCSGQSARGSGGKFLTAYPGPGEAEWRELAGELDAVTAGLPGPGVLSDRPVRPGSLVHYRFGVYAGVSALSADGTMEAMLRAPDGSLALDVRAASFVTPPWAPPDPMGTAPKRPGRPAPVLLGGRFRVTRAVRHSFTGGVFRALDRESGRPVVVKRARRDTAADLTGRDARDALRHEADMLTRLAGLGRVPALLGLFEQQGDLFLAEEEITGLDLRRWAAAHGGEPSPGLLAHVASDVCALLAEVHAEGLVVRDLTPGNVMVDADTRARLIDLELLAEPGAPVTRAYTLSYGSPEQAAAPWHGPAPQTSSDLFGLGATLFHMATGVDPLLAEDDEPGRSPAERAGAWLAAIGTPAARLAAAVVPALMDDDPARRPSPAEVSEALTRPARPVAARPLDPGVLVEDATAHLLSTMDLTADEPWPREGFAATTDPLSLHYGSAGILGVLTARHLAAPEAVPAGSLRGLAGHIIERLGRLPALPGLHFGRSGTAWALLEAGLALSEESIVDAAAAVARDIPVEAANPDVCHGVAGAGLTRLRFAEATGEAAFTEAAIEAVELLCGRAVHDGDSLLWPVPGDAPTVFAGTAHLGFAHGTAGIGAFLLTAHLRTGHVEAGRLAEAAGRSLAAAAIVDGEAAVWPERPGGRPRTHWCSGSSGVGTFLTALWRATGEPRALELARAAAVAVHRSRWGNGTSQCHGNAGDGDFLLDLAAATGEDRYRDMATDLATATAVRAARRGGRWLIPEESGASFSAGFGTGLAGVLSFLSRLRDGGRRPWLPETFTGDGERTPATSTERR